MLVPNLSIEEFKEKNMGDWGSKELKEMEDYSKQLDKEREQVISIKDTSYMFYRIWLTCSFNRG